MNPLEIAALILVIVFALIGYKTGLLRMLYSLFAWFFVLAFVTWSTPYLTEFLEKDTGLGTVIQEKAADYLEDLAEEELGETAGIFGILMEEPGFMMELRLKQHIILLRELHFFCHFLW